MGWLLTAGGLTLLLGLLVSRDKARLWLRGPAPLRHLTLAAGLVYGLTPGRRSDHPLAWRAPRTHRPLLIACGASFFYLAGALRQVRRLYPPTILPAAPANPGLAPLGASSPFGDQRLLEAPSPRVPARARSRGPWAARHPFH